MSERDYGLEISAKAAEISNELLQILQQVPKEHTEKITQIGNEIRDIMAAARKEIEPQKFYYVVYKFLFWDRQKPYKIYFSLKETKKCIEKLKNKGFISAYFDKCLFENYKEAN